MPILQTVLPQTHYMDFMPRNLEIKKPEMEEHRIIHWAKGGSSQKF